MSCITQKVAIIALLASGLAAGCACCHSLLPTCCRGLRAHCRALPRNPSLICKRGSVWALGLIPQSSFMLSLNSCSLHRANAYPLLKDALRRCI